jgi:hypothetical protein
VNDRCNIGQTLYAHSFGNVISQKQRQSAKRTETRASALSQCHINKEIKWCPQESYQQSLCPNQF